MKVDGNLSSYERSDFRGRVNCVWGDYNNDTWLDLYVVNHNGPNVLYRNDGNGTFVTLSGIGDDPGDGRSAAWVDYDLDGDVDIYLVNDGSNRLFRNDEGSSNRWLQVKLDGTSGNNSHGIGARVVVTANGVTQVRNVGLGRGYLTQDPLIAYFGLGTAMTVDLLEVHWPSGLVTTSAGVGSNQVLTITDCTEPLVVESTMSAWAGQGPTEWPPTMELYFNFETSAPTQAFKVQYRETYPTPGSFVEVECLSPNDDCVFGPGSAYEAIVTHQGCGNMKFEWQVQVRECDATWSNWIPAQTKKFTSQCLQGP